MESKKSTIQEHLAHYLAERKTRDASYSLRRMAADLGQNPAALWQILQGRNVSKKLALRLGEKMGLNPKMLSELSSEKVSPKKALTSGSLASGREPIDLNHYEVVSEWHYFAIRSLARTPDFQQEPKWVAKRLGITPTKARKAMTLLKNLGLLELDASGRLRPSVKGLVTTDGVRNLALRRRHEANLEGARQSLLRTPVDQRDFTFITMAIDPSRLPEARTRVRRFLNELCDYLEGGDQTEVYEMCMQIFPRTQINAEDEESKS